MRRGPWLWVMVAGACGGGSSAGRSGVQDTTQVVGARLGPAPGDTARDEWSLADRATKRLARSAFPELPASAREALDARRCTIPQSFIESKPHNVIRGSFARPGQVDWAVLCSVNRQSALLVFWGGTASCPAVFLPDADRHWLQGIGEGKIGYSRAISAVDSQYIWGHFEAYGGEHPPAIDHEGINDAFVEKASVVYYCFRGKWLTLTGAD